MSVNELKTFIKNANKLVRILEIDGDKLVAIKYNSLTSVQLHIDLAWPMMTEGQREQYRKILRDYVNSNGNGNHGRKKKKNKRLRLVKSDH